MKSLDEVIKAMEICMSDRNNCKGCPYDPDCKPNKKWDDALEYLKEYRNMLKNTNFAYQKGFRDGCTKQAHDDAVSRRWEEDYRASQMPWNHYTEMGG